MSNMILTQTPAQSALQFYIIITSMQLNPSILSCRLSNSSTKSSKSIFQLLPFNWKQINVTQSFSGHRIPGKCNFHFWKTSLAWSAGDGKSYSY